ncbi:NCS2 family permease [Psychromonas antarctica]|jgi:AGZA family xanthine/uracil permease-like MFS transporter|uniref:NCS2 family permease n=1 Tax=Psychromonas antarctica TaxID=67573 RepID=UPI001EE8353E|nr:NCS2 family permease [Psychromonas antarctica]MCG6200654.1 NCS2 family permease [Psychromonas antarctica]
MNTPSKSLPKTESSNTSAFASFLEKQFKFKAHKTNLKTEVTAGITTFVTMAYILFVNPDIMSIAGMDYQAVFVATALSAAIGCIFMGLYANWPVGLAPGMGLNAFFTFAVVKGMEYSWQVALGAVFISSVIFVLMSVTRLRSWIIDSIPPSLRYAMTAGVGLFLGIIGLKSAGIITASQATLVTMGDFHDPKVVLGAFSFIIIAVLASRKVFASVLIGIVTITVISTLMGLVSLPDHAVSLPTGLSKTFMQMDVIGAFDVSMISVILAFLFVNMFDTAGTIIGVAESAHFCNKEGKIENLNKALTADSVASVFGAVIGCPPVTSYVESNAGIAEGGRTGLTAVVVGLLFLVAMFFAPIAQIVPSYATAGALIYVAFLMVGSLSKINWDEFTDYVPAAITAIMMPLTYSIADGIILGFLSFTLIKHATGRSKDVSVGMNVLAVVFIAKLIFI